VEHEPGRFVLRIEGHEAELVYERRGDVLDIQHTYTPPPLRGREIAARLTETAFAYARDEGLRVVPTCSYTVLYVERHPEVRALVQAE
jgi:predicted GNAT family acetyltransferase